MPGDSRSVVLDVLRKMWHEFPGMRPTLNNAATRGRVVTLMLELYRAPAHTLDQCMAEVAKAGYHIGEYPPAPTPAVQEKPAALQPLSPEPISPPTSPSTIAGRLLVAYYSIGAAGLTADGARSAAGLGPESGAWKRVSDLHSIGLITPMRDEDDAPVLRPGDAGVNQQVLVITPHGRAVVAMMEN